MGNTSGMHARVTGRVEGSEDRIDLHVPAANGIVRCSVYAGRDKAIGRLCQDIGGRSARREEKQRVSICPANFVGAVSHMYSPTDPSVCPLSRLATSAVPYDSEALRQQSALPQQTTEGYEE